MNAGYAIVGRNGCEIANRGDIKSAYRFATRINRCAGSKIIVEILNLKTGEKYSLTCNSRRRAKEHGRNIFDRFAPVCDAFADYEGRNSITRQGSFANEMFDVGFTLI